MCAGFLGHTITPAIHALFTTPSMSTPPYPLQATLEALVKGANSDLRLILGQLQMVRLSRTSLSYDDVKGNQATSKDADLSPFDCARRCAQMSTSTDLIEVGGTPRLVCVLWG